MAIQLNDTHPAIAIPDLMRLLMDREGLGWEEAWDITTRDLRLYQSYGASRGAGKMVRVPPGRLLPRHLQIIYEINRRFLEEVEKKFPGDHDILKSLSIIEEGGGPKVRMANLAIVGSHSVNGVAALHTDILKSRVFRDFCSIWPGKVQ